MKSNKTVGKHQDIKVLQENWIVTSQPMLNLQRADLFLCDVLDPCELAVIRGNTIIT